MLYPVCQVTTPSHGSTGVFISEKYILTVFHGIEDCITHKGTKDTYEEVRHQIDVTLYEPDKAKNVKAEIVAYDESLDIALLKLLKTKSLYKATLIPENQISKCEIFDDLYIVGSPLENDPIPTKGILSSKDMECDHESYWVTDAWIHEGNSGSGVFKLVGRKYYLIGLAVSSSLTDEAADTNLTHFIPPEKIHSFLENLDESEDSLIH